MLFSRFVAEIEKEDLFHRGASITVGVSGGADSICLLHLLCRLRAEWDLTLTCAHVNHMLRADAAEDALFLKALCEKWNISYVLHEVDINKEAKRKRISTELAGREARYTFFQSLSNDYIATAHNQNDVVESVLMHMIRGCALGGLTGIAKKQKNNIIRPLLQFKRSEIEQYLKEHALLYREDSTNQDIRFTRNRIRHMVLPQMEILNPSYLDGISRMTDILRDEDALLEEQAKSFHAVRWENDVAFINIKALEGAQLPIQRRIIYSITKSYDDIQKILALAEKGVGKLATLSDNRLAAMEYDEIAVYKKSHFDLKPFELPAQGDVQFGNYTISVGIGNIFLKKEKYFVRARKEGDFFSPEGMIGTKKLKCFFIDNKIPRRVRDQIPIITCNNMIAAVGDYRRDTHFIPKNSEEFIRIQIKKTKN